MRMEIEVTVAGEGQRLLEIDGTAYADVLRALDLSLNEAVVLVDGRPVPADGQIDARSLTVLRLVHGG